MLNVTKSLFCLFTIILVCSCIEHPIPKKQRQEQRTVQENDTNDSLALDLAVAIEDAVYGNDQEAYFSLFDFETFSELATYSELQKANEYQYKNGFVGGMREGIKGLATQLYDIIVAGGTYDYVSHFYSTEDRTYKILFRMFHEEDGLNYHEYILNETDGELVFKDMYVYMSGERLSQTMNRFYLGSLPQNILEKIINGDDAPNIKNLVDAFGHFKSGQYTMALGSLDKISGRLKHEKIYHVIKIQIASKLENHIYRKALVEMANDLTDDPTASLLFVDHYIFQEEYEKALKALEKLQGETQDSFIDFIKGNVAYIEEDYPRALAYFNTVKENYPDYLSTTFKLVNTQCQMGEYERCVQLYDELLDEGIYTLEDLIAYTEEEDIYGGNELSDLVASSTYKQWKAKF